MRAVLQRVRWAYVTVDGAEVGRIGRGILALVGVTHTDDRAAADRMADKIWHLRIFPDDRGLPQLPVAAVGGEVLVVSQFTLYGDTSRGRRPSWVAAARPERAAPLIDAVVARLAHHGARVATGRFGAHMEVGLLNDGPVTLIVET